MTRANTPEPVWWSWEDIVCHAGRLGLPHFQRGAVWDSGNRAALMESLYEQSPCGSFVLWAPIEQDDDPTRHGVPLRSFHVDVEPMWLVDGQQRTRAMLDTFDQLFEATGPEGLCLVRAADMAKLPNALEPTKRSPGKHPKAWFVVLPAMRAFDVGRGEPFFGDLSESRHVQRGSMFRRLRVRARGAYRRDGRFQPTAGHPPGTIPLAALLSDATVLLDESLADPLVAALQDLTSPAGIELLDEQLPWGPHFVTGFAYEAPAGPGQPGRVMGWTDIARRLDEPRVGAQVRRLSRLFDAQWRPLFRRFQGMWSGDRFAVGWLPRGDVSMAIDAYVRINRAGIRVRAEERALALLSRARPELLDDLAEYTHRRDGCTVTDSRALLAHESGRHMGFSVWMTTLTRYSALSLLGTTARNWIGTTAIERTEFGYRLDRVGDNETKKGRERWARVYGTNNELVAEAAERTSAALLLLDGVLSSELHLDHRMARTASGSLGPLIDLLYRVPTSEFVRLSADTGFRAAMARVAQFTMLAPYIDKPDTVTLVKAIHGPTQEAAPNLVPWGGAADLVDAELRSAIGRYLTQLLACWARKLEVDPPTIPVTDALAALAASRFRREAAESRSLQHGAVGWLYALERRNRASEFHWDAQRAAYQSDRSLGVPPFEGVRIEAPLASPPLGSDGGLYPEKQHIVPFSKAARVVEKGGTRSTASPANAIGNLTWLSHRQNGLDALADRWAVLDLDRDSDNLAARGLLAPAAWQGQDLLAVDLYNMLRKALERPREEWEMECVQGLFSAFCAARTEWMCNEMEAWLTAPLPPQAARWLS